MEKIVFVLCLGLMSLAWAGEFDDFEKSLIEGSSQSVEASSTESGDASTDAFEQSLMTNADYAGMEPVYKLRESLLEYVKNKDTAKVSESIRELESMKTRECLPIQDVEKTLIYLELKMYRPLIPHMVHEFKSSYDTLEVDAGYRIAKDDGLNLYLKKAALDLDSAKVNLFENHASSIKKSNGLSAEEKAELELLMQLDGAYWSESKLNDERALVEHFVNEYPNNPDVPWLKKAVLLPMQRMDTFGMYMEDRVKNKDRLIESKYYTGGLGFNLYLLGMGTVVSGYDDLYRSDLLDPEDNLVQMEFYLQFSRIALSLGFYNSGIAGIETVDLTAGYVLYDSRHLKIRPFVGISTAFSNFTIKEDFFLGAESYYGSGSYYEKGSELDENFSESVAGWVFGTNIDLKFATTYFLLSDTKLTSFALVGRFGISTIDLQGEVVKGDGYMAFVAAGIGVYFW